MPHPPPIDDPSQGGWSDPGTPPATEGTPSLGGLLGEPTLPGDGPDAPIAGPAPSARYAIGALLGRGGMGAVYAARDTALGRDVALKELQPELAGVPGASARLAREAAVTSRLDHPGIVSVHDGGRLPDGRPFYTMRLVRGRTLGRAAAEATNPDGRRQLVRYVLAAAEAVAAAHDAGVVHRDLKPDNILIGPHGETQVVDWGLATPTPAAAARWADLPSSAARGAVGTPPYMAPEQGRGEPPDPRHDVWSLGVTLAVVVGGAGRDLPPELAAIVARATAPAPRDRYADAAAFADDLLRWFEGRRVAAYTYTPGDLLRRTLAAYRLPLGIGAAGLVALAVAVTTGWWQTTRSLDRALAAEALAVAAESDARAALADLRLEQAVAATRAGAREDAERLALAVLREREDPLARGVFAAFGRAERPSLAAEVAGPACHWSALATGVEDPWVLCGEPRQVQRWEGGRVRWSAPISAVGGEVRGDRVLLWDAGGETIVLDAATGAEYARIPMGYIDWVPQQPPRAIWVGDAALPLPGTPASGCFALLQAAAVSHDGRVAAVCGDGTLLLGTIAEPARIRVATEAARDHVAMAVAWTPGGRVVVGTLRGRVYVFDGDTGTLLGQGATELGSIGTIRISPDGRYAALGGTQGGVGLWRLDTSALVGEIPASRPRAFAFTSRGLVVHEVVPVGAAGPSAAGPSAGGPAPSLPPSAGSAPGRPSTGNAMPTTGASAPDLAAAAAPADDMSGRRGRLSTWHLPGGSPAVVRATGGLADVATSPDGALVATAAGDGTVLVVDLAEGRARRLVLGDRVVKSLSFGADGLVAAGMAPPHLGIDRGAGTWELPAGARPMRRVAWLADDTVLGADLHDGLYRWAAGGGPPEHIGPGRLFADLERDGAAAVVVDSGGRVDRVDGTGFTPLVTEPAARAVALRGERLAVATAERIVLHDAAGTREMREAGASFIDLALSADGSRVAACALDGVVRVWDAATGRLLARLPGHTERAVALEFLPDGDLVSASWDKTARVWSLAALDRPVDALAAEIEASWGPAPD